MLERKRITIEELRNKRAFICDMDGVIYHGNRLIPGAKNFLDWLYKNEKDFLFLTNSSERSPKELAQKLARLGLNVSEDHFYTSALATASFIAGQCPGGSVYAIGEPGLTNALYEAGLSMNDVNPDYVVLGETRSLSYEKIEKAVHLVFGGAKLIGTNTDVTGPSEKGIIPACRALMSPIELTTGVQAYYVGKPNPLIMRHARNKLGYHRAEVAIIGDRMDTDILAGVESEIDTVLVLSGVTDKEVMKKFAYSPSIILSDVGEIAE